MRAALLLSLLLTTPAFAGNIGVVYSCAAVQVRRVIVPDNDLQLAKGTWTGPGECLLVIDAATEVMNALEKATGVKPTNPLLAIVDPVTMKVDRVIAADPVLDASPQGKLVVKAYPGVALGQSYDMARDTFLTPPNPIKDSAGKDVIEPPADVPKVPQEPTKSLLLQGVAR